VLTIGYVELPVPLGNATPASISGGAGVTVNVRMVPAFPHNSLI